MLLQVMLPRKEHLMSACDFSLNPYMFPQWDGVRQKERVET